MRNFEIVRDLKPAHFERHDVWSEYYDFEELEDLKEWGIDKKYIDELLEVAREGGAHPYYTVPNVESLPDRIRIFIGCELESGTGRKFKGFIINPNPFVIGIFCNDEIEVFNPNLEGFWKVSEANVRASYGIANEPIFPLKFHTRHRDSNSNLIQGTYGAGDA